MRRIAVTIGDPAGIGPEIVARALKSKKLPEDVEWQVLGNRSGIEPGKPSEKSSHIAMEALQDAARGLVDGCFDGVVTGPVSKDALHKIGFDFPGQTEFFANALGVSDFGMLLSGNHLSVGLATIHEPLGRAVKILDEQRIIRIGRLTAGYLAKRGIESRRIAVAGLNPHAGEQGRFGSEEISIIAPAIEKLNQSGCATFSGPHVPDSVFREASQGMFDAVIALYHDQGLIPLKLLDFENAVNVTLGLPKPRTSPDHGTAYDLAGKGIANASSMIAAMQLCAQLCSQ